jgi:hypothetical protein
MQARGPLPKLILPQVSPEENSRGVHAQIPVYTQFRCGLVLEGTVKPALWVELVGVFAKDIRISGTKYEDRRK